MRYSILAACFAIGVILGCGLGPSAKYAAGREACFQTSKTCEEYSACLDLVAAQTGGPKSLGCWAEADAGHD